MVLEAQDRASAALNAVAASLGRLEAQTIRTGTSLPKIAGGMAIGTVAAHAFMGAVGATVGAMVNAGKGALDLSSRLEQARIGFTTMLGSAQAADGFIRKLQAFAEGTAFSFPGIQQVAQSFLAMGVEAKNVIPIVTDVTNALAAAGRGGDTEALQRVGQSLAEIQAQGKVTAEQLRELSRNGIAVMPMLADAMGTTTAEVRKLAEEGKISATEFFEAFHSEVAKRYGDIQAQQARTWAVAITNVQDILGRLTTETLADFFAAMTQGALLVQDFLKSEQVRQWAADMKASIADVMAALAPLGMALRGAMGLGAEAAATPAAKAPVEATKAMLIPPAAIKSAEDYGKRIADAKVEVHGVTAQINALRNQQDALTRTIEDTTKRYELQLTGLRDQQEALNAEVEATKAHWEGIIAPLEQVAAQLKRLEEDTKADFARIMDPLKDGLEKTNRAIEETKQGYEDIVRPLQAQVSAIDRANAALVKQRNLVNEIADLALRQKALQALGDPNMRADIAGRLKLLDLTRNELEWQKQLIELDKKGKDADKATESVQKQLDANTRERIALERQLQGVANPGLLAQVASQEVLNDAKKEQTDIDLANARIAADAAKAPLEEKLAHAKALLESMLAPLEAQATAISRAIENTAAAEAAALAPIIAAQTSVARQIEDANQGMKDALAPLEAAQKSIEAQIKAVEAAQTAALAPLKAQGEALDRQRDVLEQRKRQIEEQVTAWKDAGEAIKVANEEAAKTAKPLDLSGGAEPPDLPPALEGRSMIPEGLAEDFKNLAANVQAAADAFNNLNVASAGAGVPLGNIAGAVGQLAIFTVAAGWVKGLATATGLAAAAATATNVAWAVWAIFVKAQIETVVNEWNATDWDKMGSDWNTWLAGMQTSITTWAADALTTVTTWWASYGQKTAEQQAIDKAAWDAHQTAQTEAWNTFWTDLLTPVTTWWTDLGAKTSEEQAADLAAWEAHQSQRTEAWNTFWTELQTTATTWWTTFKADQVAQHAATSATWKTFTDGLGTTFAAAWNALKGLAETGWKAFTDWLPGAIAGVVKLFDPLLQVLKLVGDGIASLTGGGSGVSGGTANTQWDTMFGFNQPYNGPYAGGAMWPGGPTHHRGIDLVPAGGGGIGTPVGAFEAGEIIHKAMDSTGPGGLMVWLKDAQGLIHTYMHLASATNKVVGEMVARNEVLGTMGETGTVGTPHLHYEVRRLLNGDPLNNLIDPRPYMNQGRAGGGLAHELDAATERARAGLGAIMQPPNGAIEAYLRASAAERGMDANKVVAIAQTEGGLINPVRQSDVVRNGVREESFGPLQLNINGGIGARALQAGIDPRDPAQWRKAIDFALNVMAQEGTGPWMGAVKAGITNVGGHTAPVTGNAGGLAGGLAGTQAQTEANAALGASYQQVAVDLQYNAQWVAQMAAEQAALNQVLSQQAPASRPAVDAMSALGAVLGPIERQVAGGAISMDTLQFKLVDLARATGLATEPWAALDAGLIDTNEAMMQVVTQSARAGPQFEELRQELGTTNAITDEGTLKWLQLALALGKVTPAETAVTTATTAATTATGALGAATDKTMGTIDPELLLRAADAADTLTGSLGNADSSFDGVRSSASEAQSAISGLDEAARSLGSYLEEHTFEFKINLPEIPDEFVPGSPTPFEMGLRGIGHAMDDLRQKRATVSLTGGELPLSVGLRGDGEGGLTVNINAPIYGVDHLHAEMDRAYQRNKEKDRATARRRG
jgi:tape measure domain-containing protein